MIEIVKYKQIHKAIVNKIEAKFPTIKVTNKDISEGFKRPSFFIEFDNIRSEDFMREARDINLTVRIYYFSKDRNKNKIELLDMQDDLTELFLDSNLVTVNKDMKFEVEELIFNVIDKVLHCNFDIRISQNYNRDKSGIDVGDKDLMENLDTDKFLD